MHKKGEFCFGCEIKQNNAMKKALSLIIRIVNLMIITTFIVVIYYNNSLPNNYYVTTGDELEISKMIETEYCSGAVYNQNKIQKNESIAELKLLGIIPIKTVSICEVEEPVLIPCGTPFGIKLITDGVIVVEVSSFESFDGISSPAYDAGIRSGDIIKTINGVKIESNEDIEKIISESNGHYKEFEVIRDGKQKIVKIIPKKCIIDNSYRIGLWVRDSSAGIGTLTFYNPKTKVFAGLGHPVCDVDTGNILPLLKGEVVGVEINGVKKGKSGFPGELLGSFAVNSTIGTLEINNVNGLYGQLSTADFENQPLPLGMRQEIKTGKAYIYTTIEGKKPQKYEINIEKIDYNMTQECKNMVIKVTDRELLEKTGGIVQGMSGSPIIQDGKLIGAVTHVFVNNPTKGYAIFADTMYDTAFSVLKENKVA
mgnify:CR=1 FL=1